MSIYSSLILTRDFSRRVLMEHLASADDNELRALISHFLQDRTLYNCCQIVPRGQDNEDDRAQNALDAAHGSHKESE